ncbi:MAG: hypothetical protein DMF08_00515 [Verrucomicrobia bacterium]|nr:MAG: hypothetical protein DMF08_00515 [Verrucomicrobiota bacterium]
MTVRALQIFSSLATALLLAALPARGGLSTGTTYSISFLDLDGNKFSTADGHVTIVVLTTSADREQARTVGDRVPDFCLGNPAYRMITVIHFTGRHLAIGRRMTIVFIRHRMREEAKRLQARYDAQNISRDAKSDMFVVTDFDGTIASQLGQPTGATDFCVFVFGQTGKLLAQWHSVPSADELTAAVKKSD